MYNLSSEQQACFHQKIWLNEKGKTETMQTEEDNPESILMCFHSTIY